MRKKKKGRKEDFVGRYFGKLKVLEELEPTPSGVRKMRCRCECGNERITSAQNLKRGKTKLCLECLKASRIEDLTGKRFGRLTVVGLGEHRNTNGQVQQLCRCRCGNVIEVVAAKLKSGNTKSCGCYKEERNAIAHKKNKYDLSGEIGIGYTEKGQSFFFDKEDYDLIKDYYWYINKKGYVETRRKVDGKYKIMLMHRLILGILDKDWSVQGDHIHHNKNDNRKSELRICNNAQNQRNTGLQKNNSSGYKGVHMDKRKKKNPWMAKIDFEGKRYFLGYFATAEEAHQARIKKEHELQGEFSYDLSMARSEIKE